MTDLRRFSLGQRVQVRDAKRAWRQAIADSDVEGTHMRDPATGRTRKVHDFPVVWVLIGGDRVPWPAKDVRHASEEAAP